MPEHPTRMQAVDTTAMRNAQDIGHSSHFQFFKAWEEWWHEADFASICHREF
jgi:hypothetical protein